jgi:phasin family protein
MDKTATLVSRPDATYLLKYTYSMASQIAHDYNNKLLEFIQTNTKTTFDFAQSMLSVKSPSEFMELSTEHASKQLETLTAQLQELSELGQKVTLATTEPLRTSIANALTRAT